MSEEKSEEENTATFMTSASFISGHVPEEKEVQYSIGPYQVLKTIGHGGMGEVLLAYDPKCGRRIALKKIRKDLIQHKKLHNRFLKEARITSQLTHPAIMPIYAIEDQSDTVYYTMPFVQGETLKQILRTTREQEKGGKLLHHIGSSIPALIRIFLTVCHAIAYAHSKGVLHRDLKPENIMIGSYGEVLILDWGLAKLMDSLEENNPDVQLSNPELTMTGKVVGTVSYMAPERGLGMPATIQTEIYALGVTLFQILTLKNPFRRTSLEEFRKKIEKEKIEDPALAAPYRDVPNELSRITLKCLEKDPSLRYLSVDALIKDLENYIEGRSEWIQMAALEIGRKTDWEFQENVLIAEHIAITRTTDLSEWVSLMISQASFPDNTKIEASITIGKEGKGIGFLMSIPESAEREHLNDGYCLWLGSDLNKTTKLLRSTVEVIDAPDIFLERGKYYQVRIEKIDNSIYFYLNNQLQFSYITPLPLVGTHIGLLSRDSHFTLEELTIFTGSRKITLNCLAVPDAFLAHKLFDLALNEYRRVAYSFPGRAEGREALFRAGITLLEQAKSTTIIAEKEAFFEEALLEFEKLHSTPGAPLEYLGKSHVYKAMQDYEEEIKCYELGIRKYPNHPLISLFQEQLIYRMHEMSRTHRKAAYHFMLSVLRHFPSAILGSHTRKLFDSLQKHWEHLPFFIEDFKEPFNETPSLLAILYFKMELAFWLANPYALLELAEELIFLEPIPLSLLANVLFGLIELKHWKLAKEIIEKLPQEKRKSKEIQWVLIALLAHQQSLENALLNFFQNERQQKLSLEEARLLYNLCNQALAQEKTEILYALLNRLKDYTFPASYQHLFDCNRIFALLLDQKWEEAGMELHKYPLGLLTQESSPLFILYGIWLAATEGTEIAMIHFSGILDVPFPRSWTLLAHFLIGKIPEGGFWFQKAFLWEKKELYKQLFLYFHCIGDQNQKKIYRSLERECYIQ